VLIDKTLFIVLSCDKYINTRIKGIKDSWGKNVNITYLVDSSSDDPLLIGYNTQQNYD